MTHDGRRAWTENVSGVLTYRLCSALHTEADLDVDISVCGVSLTIIYVDDDLQVCSLGFLRCGVPIPMAYSKALGRFVCHAEAWRSLFMRAKGSLSSTELQKRTTGEAERKRLGE